MEPLLTTAEVAALLQVHPKHVYRLLHRGLPAQRLGGEWRFLQSAVLAWVNGGDPGGEEPAPHPDAAPPPLVAANGDVVIDVLLELSNARGGALVGFVQADRERALRLLKARAVLAAGCHGGVPPARLGNDRLARIHLVAREVGLAGRGEAVPAVGALAELRFAARPASAGVMAHLLAAARRAGVDLGAVLSRATLRESHRDVCSAVLRGEADVGLCTRAWAHRVGLGFRALATESYGLLVSAADLGDPRVVRLCEVAQGEAFRGALGEIPGYDAAGAGDIRYDAEGPAGVTPVTSARKEPEARSTSTSVPAATSPAARTTARSGKRRTIA